MTYICISYIYTYMCVYIFFDTRKDGKIDKNNLKSERERQTEMMGERQRQTKIDRNRRKKEKDGKHASRT